MFTLKAVTLQLIRRIIPTYFCDVKLDKVELSGKTLLSIPGYEDKIEFGVLVLFAYEVENSNERIVVATTRIETMLGDTAVAVHPNDDRYSHLIGKFVQHPFCVRKLPIIADTYVEMEFGTGAVKITPAHDLNDYEIGKRHNLPFITIFDDIGNIIGDYGIFTGMKRFHARQAIIEELINKKLFIEIKDNPMIVPICSRSKDVVEPLIKPQWYIKCDEMAKNAMEVVKSGKLKIIPQQFKKTWYHWMEDIRDWCISRQLWWGHRIPAYFISIDDFEVEISDDDRWISAHSEEEAKEKASIKFNVGKNKIKLQQDPDVLDTWFSSGIFPFSIFGWPDQTPELKAFYPGSLLETGHDILFFWVARMVFLGQKLLGQLPFREVYLHAMVRDAHGRKMSKSLGNVIDPIDVIRGTTLKNLQEQLMESNLDSKELKQAIEGQKRDYPQGIPECGTDALRFALCAYTSQGRDINLDILRVQGYRFFCNKLWNAVKFALTYFGDSFKYNEIDDIKLTGNESSIDMWMLSRVSYASKICDEAFGQYDFNAATTACYNLCLYDLCDVYLECLKPIFYSGTELQKQAARCVLFKTLDASLRLLSPFMPFITEELYQRLPHKNLIYPSICISPYPTEKECCWRNDQLEDDIDFVQKIVKSIRSSRGTYNIPNKVKTEVYFVCHDDKYKKNIARYSDVISILAYSIIYLEHVPPEGCTILTFSDKLHIHLLLKDLIDPVKELDKLKKKERQLIGTITKLQQSMSSEDYNIKVPKVVQEMDKEKLLNTEGELEKLFEAMKNLQSM